MVARPGMGSQRFIFMGSWLHHQGLRPPAPRWQSLNVEWNSLKVEKILIMLVSWTKTLHRAISRLLVFLDAAEWAAKQSKVDQASYGWVRFCGHTLREYEKLEEAVTMFEKALTMTSDSWSVKYGLALTYKNQKRWQLAIKTLEPVCNAFLNGNAEAADLQMGLHCLLRDLAQWHRELGEYERATELYSRVFWKYPDDAETAFEFIVLHNKQGTSAEMIRFLQEMKLRKRQERRAQHADANLPK